MLGMSWSSCRRYHPAEVEQPSHSAFGCPCCLRRWVVGSAFGAWHFRGHLCVHLRYGPMTRSLPRETLSIGFRMLVSRHPAIQATGLLTLTPAGLSPAEHASLRWTHNPACRLPAPGFPVDFFSRVMEPIVPEGLSARGSPPDTRRITRVPGIATAYSTSSSQNPVFGVRASDGA